MAQANTQGILDRIFEKFSKSRNTIPERIPDPRDPTKQIENPDFKKMKSAPKDTTALYEGLFTQTAPAQDKTPRFALSPEAISKAANQIDFMANLPAELKSKIDNADKFDPAVMTELLNHVGRSAYAQVMQHTSHLTDQFVGARVQHEMQGLPDRIRTHLAKTKASSGVDTSNPVVKEHLDLIAERISARFPEASEDEVAAMSHEYFTSMAKAINPTAFADSANGTGGSDAAANAGVDFDSYLSGEKSLEQAKAPAPAKAG